MPDQSSSSQAMQTASAQWYEAVVTTCKLDRNVFQFCAGNQMLGSTSQLLWNIFDAIPPETLTTIWNPAQISKFSDEYSSIINNLIPQNSDVWRKTMGDSYATWVAYLRTNPPLPSDGSLLTLFKNWSAFHIPDIGLRTKLIAQYQQLVGGTVPTAVNRYLEADSDSNNLGIKAYDETIADLNSQLNSDTPGFTVQVNSATSSSDVSESWSDTRLAGEYDFFGAEGNVSTSSLTSKISVSGFQITATIKHLVTFTAAPLSQHSTNPDIDSYLPWYDSAALSLAYHNDDAFTWIAGGKPSWDQEFGDQGTLRRLTTSLVVVSGLTVETTSDAAYNSIEQTAIKASAKVGFFPFFAAESQGGWSHDVSFSDSGSLTITSTVPEGVLVVLGVNATPITSIFGG